MKKNDDVLIAAGVAALVLLSGAGAATAVYTMTRGLRNNNPGNIRRGANWQGMAATQTDSAFIQFLTPEYGIRAIAKLMQTYQKLGLQTIRQIINRWAPPTENNTDAYIAAVSRDMGIGPDTVLLYAASLPRLITAIIRHENGVQPYDAATIVKGIQLAA